MPEMFCSPAESRLQRITPFYLHLQICVQGRRRRSSFTEISSRLHSLTVNKCVSMTRLCIVFYSTTDCSASAYHSSCTRAQSQQMSMQCLQDVSDSSTKQSCKYSFALYPHPISLGKSNPGYNRSSLKMTDF